MLSSQLKISTLDQELKDPNSQLCKDLNAAVARRAALLKLTQREIIQQDEKHEQEDRLALYESIKNHEKEKKIFNLSLQEYYTEQQKRLDAAIALGEKASGLDARDLILTGIADHQAHISLLDTQLAETTTALTAAQQECTATANKAKQSHQAYTDAYFTTTHAELDAAYEKIHLDPDQVEAIKQIRQEAREREAAAKSPPEIIQTLESYPEHPLLQLPTDKQILAANSRSQMTTDIRVSGELRSELNQLNKEQQQQFMRMYGVTSMIRFVMKMDRITNKISEKDEMLFSQEAAGTAWYKHRNLAQKERELRAERDASEKNIEILLSAIASGENIGLVLQQILTKNSAEIENTPSHSPHFGK